MVLLRVLGRLFRPVPDADTAWSIVQVVLALTAPAVAAVLGAKLADAALPALLGALLLLALVAAVSYQRELDRIEDRRPKLRFGDPWWKCEAAMGGPPEGEWGEFVGVHVLNEGGETARNLWFELEFSREGSEPLVLQGRPSSSPLASFGEPFEAPKFTVFELPPNSKPEPLDVAVRFENDGAIYAVNTRSLFSGGRHEAFRISAPCFRVRIRLKGDENLACEGECRSSPDFKLTPVLAGDSSPRRSAS